MLRRADWYTVFSFSKDQTVFIFRAKQPKYWRRRNIPEPLNLQHHQQNLKSGTVRAYLV
jgi:hypothetical protein